MSSSVICITGIDTGIGKTVVTGLLGRYLLRRGENVITQKIVQTGCSGLSDDILVHRKIMEIDPFDEDRDGVTCPYVFPIPCSPHLAASLAGEEIDCKRIDVTTERLQKSYNWVLLEGVGGLFVPLNQTILVIDFLEERKYPLILVSSNRIGSINHTLSALELIRQRDLPLKGIIYNCFFETDKRVEKDTRELFLRALGQYGFPEILLDCHSLDKSLKVTNDIDFSVLF